jgi:hypothetical protein
MSISRRATASILSLLLSACGSGNGDLQGGDGGNAAGSAAPVEQPGNGPGNGHSAGEPAQGVELSAPEEANSGSGVTLTLLNGSAAQIGYNLCTSSLESSAGREIPTNQVCTMELRLLEPGGSATHRYSLPVNMLEGSYRFATQVHWTDEGRTATVRSNAFEVRAD